MIVYEYRYIVGVYLHINMTRQMFNVLSKNSIIK